MRGGDSCTSIEGGEIVVQALKGGGGERVVQALKGGGGERVAWI